VKLKKIILSRGRHSTITTHNFLKDCIVLVPESERDKYKKVVKNHKIETVPDDLIGLAKVRNYCIDNYKEDVVMIDDDITAFYSVCRKKAMKIKDSSVINEIINHCYVAAHDSGAVLFGFNQTSDPRKYSPHYPILLKGWVGSIVGVIGKEYKFDERLKVRVDVDFSLVQLYEKRFIWIDNRFSFFSHKNYNAGGSSALRSNENLQNDKRLLKMKHCDCIKLSEYETTDKVNINLKRTHKIIV